MRVKRTDETQAAIVAALRARGLLVQSLHTVGGGVPDLLVCEPQTGRVKLVEVKVPKGRVRASQVEFVERGWPVVILRSVDEALAWGM